MKLPSFVCSPSNAVGLAALNQGCADCMIVNNFQWALHEQCYDAGMPCFAVSNEGREFCVSAQDFQNQIDAINANFPNNPELQQAAMEQLARDFKILNKHCVRQRDLRVREEVNTPWAIAAF